VNARRARKAHPGARDTLTPLELDNNPITHTDHPADGDDLCPYRHPDCADIRCAMALGHPGLCYAVNHNPYRAAYWSHDDD
jgi:hypothetical protein